MVPPLEKGKILRERYIIAEVVGKGGMGNVYKAEDERLPGRLCAIKEVLIDPNAPTESVTQAQAQFLQEASILAQLDHPNLPKVSDYFNDNGRDYLVMDYVPGKDLKALLDETHNNGEQILQTTVIAWAMQLLDALTYLHTHTPPVLHRDLKPANIKLTPDNRIKLVDFGLAKLLLTDDMRTITLIQGVGTALYTPLEQYGGEFDRTDAQSDIYGLGATLYTLLTGVPPTSAKERFLNPQGLQPPHELNRNVSRTVSEAIMWSMEMHPDDRPSNSEMFRSALLGQVQRKPAETLPYELDWFIAIRENWLAILIAFALFLLAVLITIF